jgi:hypothetical protein
MAAWPVLIFGAPGAIIGLLMCVVGLILKQPWLLAVGGLALLPSSLYLGGHPSMGVLLLLPLLPLLAAFTLHRGHRVVASLILVPNAAAALWLSIVTIQNLVAR